MLPRKLKFTCFEVALEALKIVTRISALPEASVLFLSVQASCSREQTSLSHLAQLPAKVLTWQFRIALPVSCQNLPKQKYHRYLPLFRCLGNTKLSSLMYLGLLGLQIVEVMSVGGDS